MGIKLVGAGEYLPEKVVGNEQFEKLVDTSNEWIVRRTGISHRHYSCAESTVQMGLKAAKQALENAKVLPSELDLIIFSSVTSDFAFPSMSNILQGKLDATNAIGIDISCACSGFVYALDMAHRYIASNDGIETVLIVCSENMTKLVDFSDRTTCVLFGDGAGAVVVRRSENEFFSVLKTDGKSSGLIYSNLQGPGNFLTTPQETAKSRQAFAKEFFEISDDSFLHMNGRAVYRQAIDSMVSVMQQVCRKAEVDLLDLDCIIPHQANVRIIDRVMQKLGAAPEKVLVNIQKTGNISSACIPVCLAQSLKQGRVKSGDKIGLVSFGAGLIYGAIVFTI